jgi:hypothetical protein
MAADLVARLTAQLLGGEPARDPVGVAERILAVQAQDPKGARLAVRARTRGATASDVDRALSDERSLVITTLNRGTLHLVRTEDLPWLHALTTPPVASANARRLAQEGVAPKDAERGVRAIERALTRHGPLGRDALREHVAAAGVRTAGQAFVHVVMLAALRGLIVRGPMLDGEHVFVLVHDWLGGPLRPLEDRGRALGELARRYLAGHGPGDAYDLARWAGLPLRDIRAGLAAIASQLEHREDGLVDLAHRAPRAELPPPRLLGPFDPLLHAWRDREPILGEHRDVVTTNGVFRAIALVRGRAVATWRIPKGTVVLEPFEALSPDERRALEDDARDVERFLAG